MSTPRAPLWHRIDATAILTFYVVVLMAVPAALRAAALGTAGSPASMLAVATFLWWTWYHVQRIRGFHVGAQPVRTAMLLLLLVVLAAYAHAMVSPLPVAELTPADSGLLEMVGLVGIALVAHDGITSLERHRAVVRRLVIAVGLIALLGLVQYVTKQAIVDRISIPGLSAGTSEWTLAQRSGLARPSGTSTHPIEYGVVLTMSLPLAIVFAMHAPRHRWLYRGVLAVVAFAIFLSLSRSAILCGATALVVLAASWSVAARLKAAAALLVLFTMVYLSVPGLLGTLTRLFTGVSNDTSVASRTDSYEVAFQFIGRSPVIGRGYGTFLPDYWILDNQYLLQIIETGAVGFAALLFLVYATVRAARRSVALATEDFDREVSRGLLAGVLAGAMGLAFFDTFSFPQSAGTLFLLIGLSGAMWRLQRSSRARAAALSEKEVAPQASVVPRAHAHG